MSRRWWLEETDLIAALEALGVDAADYAVVALLPLVQVAWADGVVQPAERAAIMRIAAHGGLLGVGGSAVLERWLSQRPSGYYLSRGRKVLAALSARSDFDDVSLDTLEDVVSYCHGVAASAGGLFGVFGNKVGASEREAIAEIARALHVQGNGAWTALRQGSP